MTESQTYSSGSGQVQSNNSVNGADTSQSSTASGSTSSGANTNSGTKPSNQGNVSNTPASDTANNGGANVVNQIVDQVLTVIKQDPVGAAVTATVGGIVTGVVYAATSQGIAAASGILGSSFTIHTTASGIQTISANISSGTFNIGSNILRRSGGDNNNNKESKASSAAAAKDLNRSQQFELIESCPCAICSGARMKSKRKKESE